MKRKELIEQFIDRMPEFYVTAADHPFKCTCNPCATFLLDGILDYIEDEKWAQDFLNEEVEGDLIVPLKDVQTFHHLCDEAY